MRLQLSLRPVSTVQAVPVNYQYPLSAAIYKILNKASPEYATFLHDQGYTAPSGRLMKLFTFSRLWIPAVRFKNNALYGSDALWRLRIASPMNETFVQNFVLGLFETQNIIIAGRGLRAELLIELVETLPQPEFTESMRFKCLSPVTASTPRVSDGKPAGIRYYAADDPDLPEAIRKNLLQKHEIINPNLPVARSHREVSEPNDSLQFILESKDRPKSKLITIKEGTPQETKIKAFETTFTLQGSPELMQTAWLCGIGEHGAQGFGMIDII